MARRPNNRTYSLFILICLNFMKKPHFLYLVAASLLSKSWSRSYWRTNLWVERFSFAIMFAAHTHTPWPWHVGDFCDIRVTFSSHFSNNSKTFSSVRSVERLYVFVCFHSSSNMSRKRLHHWTDPVFCTKEQFHSIETITKLHGGTIIAIACNNEQKTTHIFQFSCHSNRWLCCLHWK